MSKSYTTDENSATNNYQTQIDEGFIICEEKPLHHYRIEIPNCIDDLELDPYTFRVYCHIKRVASDNGKCWQSIPNIAEHCKMSKKKVRQALHILENGKNKFNSILIKISPRKRSDGGDDTSLITIIDIWNLNLTLYKKKKERGGSPQEGGGVPSGNQGGSPQEPKERTNEEKPFIRNTYTSSNTKENSSKFKKDKFVHSSPSEVKTPEALNLSSGDEFLDELISRANEYKKLLHTPDIIARWISKFGSYETLMAINFLLYKLKAGTEVIRKPEAYIEKVLKDKTWTREENQKTNRQYVREFVKVHKLKDLKIMQTHCYDEKKQKEFTYDVTPEAFEKQMEHYLETQGK